MKEVHCNNCDWKGDNSELENFTDENGAFIGCPTCETDSYLMNIQTKCDSCGKSINVEEYNENDGLCDACELSSVSFDVYEDNGYGINNFVEKHIVEGIQLKQAIEKQDFLVEKYHENNSAKTETGFFFFTNPSEVK
jgi:Zn finger protein HypA/HybF involved in hydrogenase expression